MDGYTEIGTTNALTVDDGDVHISLVDAALALPFARIAPSGALTTIRLTAYADARLAINSATSSPERYACALHFKPSSGFAVATPKLPALKCWSMDMTYSQQPMICPVWLTLAWGPRELPEF